jgi:hypothetical protein
MLGLAILAAGCGGSNIPGATGSGLSPMAQGVAYARCMRSHGVPDFPDPTASPGGGVAFQVNGGPGSDLDHNNPRFQAADHACRSLLPGGGQAPPPSAQKLAAEVKWARCMRSHGLPGFPDPDAQGAFDSSRFDDSSPGFQTASNACKSLEPTGPMSAVPGHGSGP